MKSYLFIFFIVILFGSCSNSEPIIEEEPVDYNLLNETEIQNYITENNLSTKKSSSGLYYIIKETGTGKTPSLNSNVTLSYKGYFTTNPNLFFDESPKDGIDFDLKNLITGFAEGVTYLKEGGEATLIIPSKIGYPSNSFHAFAGKVILFDIKLISVN